jgi:hypothetical protein
MAPLVMAVPTGKVAGLCSGMSMVIPLLMPVTMKY